jgi:hypothetical protein
MRTRLLEQARDAGDVLDREQEHGQVHRPLAGVVEVEEVLLHRGDQLDDVADLAVPAWCGGTACICVQYYYIGLSNTTASRPLE